RLVQLCGFPVIEGPAAVREELEGWMRALPAGPGQRGLGSWLETHLDHLLVYGKAVGEILAAPSRREGRGLGGLDPRLVLLEPPADPLGLRVLLRRGCGGEPLELPRERTLVSLHAPQGCPHGTSLLRSLPFVAETLSIIENATAQVWMRL